jgi:hypothetical protein
VAHPTTDQPPGRRPDLWVPETAFTSVDLPIRHLRAPDMIRRWRYGRST